MDLDQAIRERRSVRRFVPGARIPRPHLEAILEAGCWAPSSTNSQPWRFVVVTRPALITQLAGLVAQRFEALSRQAVEVGERKVGAFMRFLRSYGSFFADAPAVVVACAEPYSAERFGLSAEAFRNGAGPFGGDRVAPVMEMTVVKSVAMAVQNQLLKAHALGYAGVPVDTPLVVDREIGELLDLPPSWRLIMLVVLGVPAGAPRPLPRRPLGDVVQFVE